VLAESGDVRSTTSTAPLDRPETRSDNVDMRGFPSPMSC
jgi:hypothetical protein